jgi:TetR/AcrR family transcriptional repressor of nem operon
LIAASIIEGRDREHYQWFKWRLEEGLKVSGAKVAEHRSALIATARRLLQEQGFEGAGVAEISREAGLTQGALYSQFKSKDALAAEATREAFTDGLAAWARTCETAPDTLRAYMDAYLSTEHSKACLSEVRRQDPAICEAFGDGFVRLAELVQGALPEEVPAEEARRRALALLSAMVGSVAMARAVEATNPELAKEIITAARTELGDLAVRRR